MKKNQIKIVVFLLLVLTAFSSCTKDSDAQVSSVSNTLFYDNFDNTDFTTKGWTTVAEVGTKKWFQKTYNGDGYAFFSTYQGTEPINVTWLISKGFDMDKYDGEKLFFQTCTDGYIKSIDNSLELYVSTDYSGNSSDFSQASWSKVPATFAGVADTKYVYVNSGIIDLSSYKGTLYFAFKMRGTNTLTGGYQIDNVRLFY